MRPEDALDFQGFLYQQNREKQFRPLGYMWVRLPESQSWHRLYVRYNNACLLFCRKVDKNEFVCCYVLYNSTISRMRLYFDKDGKEEDIIKIKHEYDTDYLLLILDEYKKMFGEIYDFLLERSIAYSKDIMSLVNETNRYSFGKIHIRINTLNFFPCSGSIFVKIILSPYTVESKRVRGIETPSTNGAQKDYVFK
jgi:hypothetical protein